MPNFGGNTEAQALSSHCSTRRQCATRGRCDSWHLHVRCLAHMGGDAPAEKAWCLFQVMPAFRVQGACSSKPALLNTVHAVLGGRETTMVRVGAAVSWLVAAGSRKCAVARPFVRGGAFELPRRAMWAEVNAVAEQPLPIEDAKMKEFAFDDGYLVMPRSPRKLAGVRGPTGRWRR
jgi:hypothetical protein